MKKECDNYPNLNHEACEPNQYEEATAAYFESRGLFVERLCTRWLGEGRSSPDFRVSKEDKSQFLCEVKHVLSSTAALPETDWHYENKDQYKSLILQAKEQGMHLVAFPDQIALWKGEVPYPVDGRNTKQKESEYEQRIRDKLGKMPVAFYPLEVTLHRHDPFIWREDEIQQFVTYIAESLSLINVGRIPYNWHCDFGLYTGHYRQPRDHGRFIQNFIEVRQQGHCLVINSISYLGANWLKIEKDCHEAQRQIRDRLEQEHGVQDIARIAMLFIEEDLIFEYSSEFPTLVSKIRRHIQSKSPELSAVAFCSDQLSPDIVNPHFTVFHVAQGSVPPLDKAVFENGASSQIDV